MWWGLYHFGILLYWTLAHVVSLFNPKAADFLNGRKQPFPVIGQKKRQRLWVHVSSLGEFEQSRPVIELLKADRSVDITLTFYSPSGYNVRSDYPKVDRVLYIPMDFRSNANQFLEHFDFDLILFVKYDFWMNHLFAAQKRDIPIIFFSVILRPDQIYWGLGKHFYLPIFGKINHFFVQNNETYELLNKHGITQVTEVGDTRFDRVQEIATNLPAIAEIESFRDGRLLFVLGSVWPSDMDFFTEILNENTSDFQFVIAPHNIDLKSIDQLVAGMTNYQLYTSFDPSLSTDYLILDNMGLLASAYKYADYTYIGGAFRGTLHNTLEAAAHGKPVFFGKHPTNKKFVEAKGLVDSGAGFEVAKITDLKIKLNELKSDQKAYLKTCESALKYVSTHSGASKEIVAYVKEVLN